MIEITNRTRGPIQLLVRSRRKLRSMGTLVLPGRATKVIPDEIHTEYIQRAETNGLISTRRVSSVTQ